MAGVRHRREPRTRHVRAELAHVGRRRVFVALAVQEQQLAADAAHLVARVRRFSSLPVAVGFGISTAEQFQAVGQFADAAVIGSAIVSLIEKHGKNAAEPVASFIRGLRVERSVAQAER